MATMTAIASALAFHKAVTDRATFIEGWGGYTNFFDIHHYGENKRAYHRLEDAVIKHQTALRAATEDLKEVARSLRCIGADEAADLIDPPGIVARLVKKIVPGDTLRRWLDGV